MKAISNYFLNTIKLLKNSFNNWAYYSQEPTIIHKKNRHNNDYFQVYDPVSGWSGNFTSETEVRTWLEKRYYHSSNNY